jgi:hypothetical protein
VNERMILVVTPEPIPFVSLSPSLPLPLPLPPFLFSIYPDLLLLPFAGRLDWTGRTDCCPRFWPLTPHLLEFGPTSPHTLSNKTHAPSTACLLARQLILLCSNTTTHHSLTYVHSPTTHFTSLDFPKVPPPHSTVQIHSLIHSFIHSHKRSLPPHEHWTSTFPHDLLLSSHQFPQIQTAPDLPVIRRLSR